MLVLEPRSARVSPAFVGANRSATAKLGWERYARKSSRIPGRSFVSSIERRKKSVTLQSQTPFLRVASACAILVFVLVLGCGRASAQLAARTPPSRPVERELDAFAHALSGVTKYSATVTIFDQMDAQTQNVVFAYTFSKPSNVTVRVIAGPNAGITLDWNGGSTIVARRGSGLAAMFSKTLSLHDPLVTTLRGASIDQLSFGAILSRAQLEVDRLSLIPGGTIDGVPANALSMVSTGSAANPNLTREVVEMSVPTHLPIRVLGYNGLTLVSSIGFSDVKLSGRE